MEESVGVETAKRLLLQRALPEAVFEIYTYNVSSHDSSSSHDSMSLPSIHIAAGVGVSGEVEGGGGGRWKGGAEGIAVVVVAGVAGLVDSLLHFTLCVAPRGEGIDSVDSVDSEGIESVDNEGTDGVDSVTRVAPLIGVGQTSMREERWAYLPPPSASLAQVWLEGGGGGLGHSGSLSCSEKDFWVSLLTAHEQLLLHIDAHVGGGGEGSCVSAMLSAMLSSTSCEALRELGLSLGDLRGEVDSGGGEWGYVVMSACALACGAVHLFRGCGVSAGACLLEALRLLRFSDLALHSESDSHIGSADGAVSVQGRVATLVAAVVSPPPAPSPLSSLTLSSLSLHRFRSLFVCVYMCICVYVCIRILYVYIYIIYIL